MYTRTNPVRLLPFMLLSASLLVPPSWAQPRSEAGFIIKCPHIPTGLGEIPTCRGEKATCLGSDGHDLIWGSEMRNVIYAGAGNDVIKGSQEDDVICGGPGNDMIHGARGDDFLYGDEGSDMLFAGPGADTLDGGPDDFDVLWGGPDFDQLDGGDGVFDYCLMMRDEGKVNVKTCEIIFPPLGFDHDAGEEIPPGLLSPTAPRSSGRRTPPTMSDQAQPKKREQDPEGLFVALTSAQPDAQVLALTLARHASDAGKKVHILLCGSAADLALREAAPPASSNESQRRRLLDALREQGIPIDVCPEYLEQHGLQANMLIDGVEVTDWRQTIQRLMGPHGKFMAF